MDLSSILKNLIGIIDIMIVIFTPKVFFTFTILFLAVIATIIVFIVMKKKKKKYVLGAIGIEVLLTIALFFIYFSAKDFPRVYLEKDSLYQTRDNNITLKEAAEDRGIYIGFADNMKNIEKDGYSDILGKEFNAFTPENAFKWSKLLKNGEIGNYDFTKADKYVKFAEDNNLRLRGHVLIWGKGYPSQLKEKLNKVEYKEEFLRSIMREHITKVMKHFEGQVDIWDVVNEPIDLMEARLENNIFYEVLGKEYISYAFELAHKADPNAELFMNGYIGKDPQVLLNLLQELVDEGVPIHGFGLQGHIMNKAGNVKKTEEFLKQVSDMGLKVEITELDVRLRALEEIANDDIYEAQGKYFGEVLEACLRVDNFTGITCWGVSDKNTWYNSLPPYQWMKPNDPLLFDVNLNKKPAYYHIYDVLKNDIK